MNNINIIFDELRHNEIDIDKQTLSFHINAILDHHRDLYREVSAHGLNLDQVYREINVTNFGRIFAYLALVSMQSDSEESVRENVRKTIEAFQAFHIPKAKRNNKPPILITLSLILIALYISL
ncbi:Hypothetical predicted protein [Paramuricea clavata]|uniref:Uncharacterized protein n=1 Tax=Paramuricea clavata TaxID=317549 RepID=A0A7D9MA69_PARCT|nr:Hypothetical predicted protein [Paramuricea clavata]